MSGTPVRTKLDIVIIGAGVVGLAIAAAVGERFSGAAIGIIEKNQRPGMETSSRNSGVLHAGIYYPSASHKAVLAVEGNAYLREYAQKNEIPWLPIGKMVVATEAKQEPVLEQIAAQARINGVVVSMLARGQVQQIEPQVRARSALFVPSTAVIDSGALIRCLYQQVRRHGVAVALGSCLHRIEKTKQGYALFFPDGMVETSVVVNAAGLGSDQIAAMAGIDIDAIGYRLQPIKGEYFRIASPLPIKHLLYPIPEREGLGIHLTIDTIGGQRLGPNAYPVLNLDYNVDEGHRQSFFEAASRYLPDLREEALLPDYAGIRPRLYSAPGGNSDFIIQEESSRGFPNFINLIGIESPGLTACLAIARLVRTML